MTKQIMTAVLIAVAAMGSAMAADTSPAYVGADVGTQLNGKDGTMTRAYAGYNVGTNLAFGLPQVHALELMVFTGRSDTDVYEYYPGLSTGGDRVRTTGLGVNWTTATRLDEKWSLTTRLGANYAWTTTRYARGYQSYTYDRPGVTAGVGLAYKLNPNVSLTLDLSYMPIKRNAYEKTTAPTLGTGLRYEF